jgi:hypothetical protein
MGHFGSRVIGTKRATEEAAVEKVRADHFGPRVIGEVFRRRRAIAGTATAEDVNAEAAEAAEAADKDTRSDPKKKKAKRAKKAKEAEDTKVEATGVATPEEKSEMRAKAAIEDVDAPTFTIEELQKALADNEEFYETLYRGEFERASGPRRTALRTFLLFEMEHENRDDRKLEIEKAIEAK